MAPLFQEVTISCDSSIASLDCTLFKGEKTSSKSISSSDCYRSQSHEPCSNVASALRKSEDPFLYYSNDDVRMKTLRLEEVSDSSTRTENATRKTRLSFEVHPSMIFDDMLDELYGDDDDLLGEIDIDNLEADGSGSVSDLLAQLLQI
mmetsp:Transcript_27813/g.47279  ORF Transcript_27813/g.47279 Transcript_27813/m.47279 type:complete len:148 (-) Transcript_27813:58-501(-)